MAMALKNGTSLTSTCLPSAQAGDIARGSIAALKPLGFEVINLGSDRPVKLNHVINLIEQFYGMWKDRTDMADSAEWVRKHRENWNERLKRNPTITLSKR